MKYIAGIKLLERGVILQYMKQAGVPVSMPEILRLRGIPVPKRGEGSEEAKKTYAFKATTVRQLMLRICKGGYAVADKGRQGLWSLRFVLTPKGRLAAEECEEFLSYINTLQRQVAQALATRSGDIRAPPSLPGEEVPAEGAKVTLDQTPLKVAPEPEIPTIPSKVVRPAPKIVPEMPVKVPNRPWPKTIAPAPVTPKATPRPAVLLPPKAKPNQLRCPACPNVFPISSIKREMDRRGRFQCDCGIDLTDEASVLMDGLTAGGD